MKYTPKPLGHHAQIINGVIYLRAIDELLRPISRRKARWLAAKARADGIETRDPEYGDYQADMFRDLQQALTDQRRAFVGASVVTNARFA